MCLSSLGIYFFSLVAWSKLSGMLVSLAGDADLVADESNAAENMQLILNVYNIFHEAGGRKMQE